MFRLRRVCLHIGMNNTRMILKRDIHRKHRYYEALGLTPKATQSDIKKAYYKLSMEFHPDKASGNDMKFKEISAAYEVLGNLKLRRMYDRGLLPSEVSNVEDVDISIKKREPDFSQGNTYSEEKRKTHTGRTETYNFDEWTRAHYSENFSRNHESRKYQWMQMRSQKVNQDKQARMEIFIWTLGCFFLSFVVYGSAQHLESWDKPRKRKEDT